LETVALFQAKHAAAAATAAGVTDEKTALDWLMLHVAEAELPKRFAPGAAGDPIGIRKLAVAQSAAYRGTCALEVRAERRGGPFPSAANGVWVRVRVRAKVRVRVRVWGIAQGHTAIHRSP